ncbi:MAG: F0F1 ATP synthase subunit B [Planctomycetota bacterium]
MLLMLGLLGAAVAPTVAFAADPPAGETSTADDGHDEKKDTPGPLNLKYGEAIWNLLVFLIVLALLAKFVFPVIRDGLKAREQKLEGDLTAAEQAKAEAQASVAEYKQKIAEAQKQAQAVVEEAKKTAEQVAMKLKTDAEAEIAKIKERAEADIASAKEAALGEVYTQTAELATLVAGKILQREINAQDQQQLVQDSLAELTKSGA